jgi:hypothetical protein
MGIMGKDFDFDAIRKERARKAASGGVDLETALRQISPDIEKLNVGQTAQIAIPKGTGLRKFVMSITAKLNNLTPKGAPWEGRQYKVISDGEGYAYVQRGENTKSAPVRARRGGGRRPANATPSNASKETTVEGGAVVTA